MRTHHRILILLASVTVLVASFAIPAQAGPSGTLLSRINASRAAAGKAPLETYWDLTDDANAHTNRMVSEGRVYHNPSLSSVTGVWQALGENVGVGLDANQLHDEFMASSGHRANILGDYNYVGIGTAVDESGLIWATVIFMRADPGLNGGGETTTTTTSAPVQSPTPQPQPRRWPSRRPPHRSHLRWQQPGMQHRRSPRPHPSPPQTPSVLYGPRWASPRRCHRHLTITSTVRWVDCTRCSCHAATLEQTSTWPTARRTAATVQRRSSQPR